jgi:hypothetical protein
LFHSRSRSAPPVCLPLDQIFFRNRPPPALFVARLASPEHDLSRRPLDTLRLLMRRGVVGTNRTAWHVLFGGLLRKRGPRSIRVLEELPLWKEPPRVDYLIVRNAEVFDPLDPGLTLRGLWPMLSRVAVIELKSVGRPYRTGTLDRLWSYTHTVCADDAELLERRSDLCAVLIVPCRTRSLEADARRMGLVWRAAGPGYWSLEGGLFALHVVEIDVVAEQEEDDVLRLFGHGNVQTIEARRFLAEQVGSKEAEMAIHELEGYDEVVQKLLEGLSPEQRLAGLAPEQVVTAFAPEQVMAAFAPEQRLAGLAPEQRLAGLAPEQRLAGLAPEQRLAGLAPEQIVLTLPDDVLRALSDDYIATLPEPMQDAVRARRARK